MSFYVGGGLKNDINVGENVYIGMGSTICCIGHELGSNKKRAGKQTYQTITIGDGCWLGANTTVLGGVTIGSGSVIAAGAVVACDVEPNCLYGGVPARKIRGLS